MCKMGSTYYDVESFNPSSREYNAGVNVGLE